MSKESKYVCQWIAAVLLLSTVWISSSFAGKPERPPEADAQVDLEVDPNEAKVAPENRLAALPPQRDSQTASTASNAVKLLSLIHI